VEVPHGGRAHEDKISGLITHAVLLAALLFAPPAKKDAPKKDGPSRPASKDCRWEKVSDATLGLQAWVSRCDYHFRKIEFLPKGRSLVMRFSDGGEPEPVVDVYDLAQGETPEAGMKRVYAEKTDKAVASRCVLAPAHEGKPRRGVKRWTFVPDKAYAAELKKTQRDDEIQDPPCGDLGTAPDGIQYFETQEGAHGFLFVRVGQDIPLFDEETLRILPR
jgi:hypothetical protein